MDDEKIRDIFKDDNLSNEISQCFKSVREQTELFTTKCIVQDIIDAYNGKLDWNNYLEERHRVNSEIRVANNKRIINFSPTKEEYKVQYQCELPILDYTTFCIAERLGQLERKKEVKE